MSGICINRPHSAASLKLLTDVQTSTNAALSAQLTSLSSDEKTNLFILRVVFQVSAVLSKLITEIFRALLEMGCSTLSRWGPYDALVGLFILCATHGCCPLCE